MGSIKPIPAGLLRPRCDPNQFKFKTTNEIEPIIEAVGQEVALESLQFGVEINHPDYHLYALGTPGIGKSTIIKKYLKQTAQQQPSPSDWCYVHNFASPNTPLALELPSGQGKILKQNMYNLIQHLRFAIPALFESDEFRSRIQQLDEEYKQHEEQALKEMQAEAEKNDMTILKTHLGLTVVQTHEGKVLTDEEIAQLSESDKQKREQAATQLRQRLTKILSDMPVWYKEKHQKQQMVEKEFCERAVKHLMEELVTTYADSEKISHYLTHVQEDIINNPRDFLKTDESMGGALGLSFIEKPSFTRYEVNVLIVNKEKQGAPVIFERNPNYSNLIGKIEYKAQLGMLLTDFTLIKPGALHKANGGFLVLDIMKVLMNPYAWESLKRILFVKKINIEPMGQMLGLAGSTPLEPEPIPLKLKIILLGNHQIYNLLGTLDSEFKKLFKVAVDFEDFIERTPQTVQQYAQLIAAIAKNEQLLALDAKAVARIVDYSMRSSNNTERLSIHMHNLTDILQQANYWATKSRSDTVGEQHVQQAIDAAIKRVDRVRKHFYKNILNDFIMIDVESHVVGQINGVSVMEQSNFSFGVPSRITVTTRLGNVGVIDIERKVKLGGAIHSKGVLILSGFLEGRYVRERPLALSASLVFEQTYGRVEGDSASAAELCALLSSLSELPIKQGLAITGSINQHGQIQAIGGVNEKIEGFFDICKMKGFTGEQGVLIPAANVKNLMLREEVVEAVKNHQFNVYPVKTIDEALTLLTGVPAGERDKRGNYPKDSVNGRCESVLLRYADLRARQLVIPIKPSEKPKK